jgi:hypothetical protein
MMDRLMGTRLILRSQVPTGFSVHNLLIAVPAGSEIVRAMLVEEQIALVFRYSFNYDDQTILIPMQYESRYILIVKSGIPLERNSLLSYIGTVWKDKEFLHIYERIC